MIKKIILHIYLNYLKYNNLAIEDVMSHHRPRNQNALS